MRLGNYIFIIEPVPGNKAQRGNRVASAFEGFLLGLAFTF